MEKKYVCPVCGKEVGGLGELNSCIAKHMAEEKAVNENLKQKKIETLKAENENLMKKLDKNCKELEKLGVSTSHFYSVNPSEVLLRDIDFVKKEKDENLTKEDYDNIFKDFNSFITALLDPRS